MTRIFTSACGLHKTAAAPRRNLHAPNHVKNTLAYSFPHYYQLPPSAPLRKWECQTFFLWWWWLLCVSILNFNSQQSTVLDRAVCIINDVQIPHMKGLHCGLDERLCVLSLFLFLPRPVYSYYFFLFSHLRLILHHIFSCPLFFNTFCNQFIWKAVRKNVHESFSFSPDCRGFVSEHNGVWHQKTAFCLRSLGSLNNTEFSLSKTSTENHLLAVFVQYMCVSLWIVRPFRVFIQ